jgi:hypothetical protein
MRAIVAAGSETKARRHRRESSDALLAVGTVGSADLVGRSCRLAT